MHSSHLRLAVGGHLGYTVGDLVNAGLGVPQVLKRHNYIPDDMKHDYHLLVIFSLHLTVRPAISSSVAPRMIFCPSIIQDELGWSGSSSEDHHYHYHG